MNPESLRAQLLAQSPAPTEQQQGAIFAPELEFLLRAAPGSGKTWTACRRYVWRAAKWPHTAGGIALLSYTNIAVREFQDEIVSFGHSTLLSEPNYLGTLDSFVERFLIGPFGHLITGATSRPRLFQGVRPGDRNNSKLKCWTEIKDALRPIFAWDIRPAFENDGEVFRASKEWGRAKLERADALAALSALLTQGRYTHDQRAYWGYTLLRSRPHIAKHIAKCFPEIIVDEAQDTNVWLLEMLDILRSNGSKITLVGDPDQCIYSFAMADANGLKRVSAKWQIPERPLDVSFRCNDPIASAIKQFGTNASLKGRGDGGRDSRRAFVICETDADFRGSINAFQKALEVAGVPEASSTIVCRGSEDLRAMCGPNNFQNLQGIAKRLAEAAFCRESRRDFNNAYELVDGVLRELIWDDSKWTSLDNSPESEAAIKYRVSVWRFVKSKEGLPSVALPGKEWISTAKVRLAALIATLGAPAVANLGMRIKRNGLDDGQLANPLFDDKQACPRMRRETIHKVKGESIDAVLVLGSKKFWDSVVKGVSKGEDTEDRRVAYVAMSRARDLLVVSLPAAHHRKHVKQWNSWGFASLEMLI